MMTRLLWLVIAANIRAESFWLPSHAAIFKSTGPKATLSFRVAFTTRWAACRIITPRCALKRWRREYRTAESDSLGFRRKTKSDGSACYRRTVGNPHRYPPLCRHDAHAGAR